MAESLLAEATGDTPEDMTEDLEPFHNIVFLVDVEDPDTPIWAEALKSDEHDKWLEGAEVELKGLREMKIYKVV